MSSNKIDQSSRRTVNETALYHRFFSQLHHLCQWPLATEAKRSFPSAPCEKKPQVLRVCLALQWVDNKAVSMLTTSGRANDAVEVKLKTKTGGKWDKKR